MADVLPVNEPSCLDAPPFADGDDADELLAAAARRPYAYFVDFFAPRPEEQDTFQFALSAFKSNLVALGWRRVYLADAITGTPGAFSQLWQVPREFLQDDRIDRVERSDFHRAFTGKLKDALERLSLLPMPYDTGPVLPDRKNLHAGPPNILLVNRLSVRKGAMERFADLKAKFFLPAVTEPPFGWRLVAAGASPDHHGQVLQLWELPNADRLAFTMQRIGQDSIYRQCLAPCIETEDQQLSEVIDWG